jgi:CHAT domain-containing protein
MGTSYAHTIDYVCAECDRSYQTSLWLLVDQRDKTDALERCRIDTIHCHQCPHGHPFRQDLPLLIVHRSSKRLLYSPAPPATPDQAAQELAALISHAGDGLPWKTPQSVRAALWVVRREMLALALAGVDRERLAQLEDMYQASAGQMGPLSAAEQLALCEQAVRMFRREQAPMLWGTFAGRMASALRSGATGDRARGLERAIALCEEILAEFQGHAEPFRVALAQVNLGAFCGSRVLGDTTAALDRELALLRDARRVLRPRLFPQLFAQASLNTAINLFKRPVRNREADTEQAISALEEGAAAISPERDPDLWGDVHQHLGIGYFRRIAGDRRENIEGSIAAYEAALITRTESRAPGQRVLTLMDLGNSLLERVGGDRAENLEHAIDTYTRGADLARQLHSDVDWARLQYDLSFAYLLRVKGEGRENARQAIAAGLRALTVFTEERHPMDWGRVQQNLGIAYRELARRDGADEWQASVDAFSAALSVRTAADSPADFMMTADNLAATLVEGPASDSPDAQERSLALLTQAESVDPREVAPHVYARFLVNLATAYRDRKTGDLDANRDRAIAIFRRAITLAREQGQYDEQIGATLRLADLEIRRGDWNAAYRELSVALPIVERSYLSTVSEAGREQAAERNWSLCQLLTETCLRCGKPTEAFMRWEEGTSRALRDELAMLDLPAPDVAEGILDEERNLVQRSRELDLVLRNPSSPTAHDEALPQSEQVRARLHEVWAELALDARLEQYVNLRRGDHLRWNELADWLADRPQQTALVAFARLREQWVAFIVRAGDSEPRVEELELSDTDALAVAIEWRKPRDEEPGQNDAARQAMQRVAATLLPPVFKHLSGVSSVCLIPYGLLHYIPIHAMSFEGHSMLDAASVWYSPSAAVAARGHRFGTRRTAVTTMFVVGNPSLDLPAAEHEAITVAGLFSGTAVIGRAATLERVRDGMRTAGTIHFAAHATFSESDPFSSGVLLADGAILTAQAMLAERLDASLVVLSACETGLQRIRPSNSLTGLVRAFMYAGARTLVVSLWAVDDLSTMLLLSQFYGRLSRGAGVADALRGSQLWLKGASAAQLAGWFRDAAGSARSDGRGESDYSREMWTRMAALPQAERPFEDAYYWAPFVVIGMPE